MIPYSKMVDEKVGEGFSSQSLFLAVSVTPLSSVTVKTINLKKWMNVITSNLHGRTESSGIYTADYTSNVV